MNKKIIKKLTAAFLGILFVMSMSITSMAAEPWDSIPNLLPYPNKAEFNKVVTIPLVFPKTIELKVQGQMHSISRRCLPKRLMQIP